MFLKNLSFVSFKGNHVNDSDGFLVSYVKILLKISHKSKILVIKLTQNAPHQ